MPESLATIERFYNATKEEIENAVRNFARQRQDFDLQVDWEAKGIGQLKISAGNGAGSVVVKLTPINNNTRTNVITWAMNQNSLLDSPRYHESAKRFNETSQRILDTLILYLDNATGKQAVSSEPTNAFKNIYPHFTLEETTSGSRIELPDGRRGRLTLDETAPTTKAIATDTTSNKPMKYSYPSINELRKHYSDASEERAKEILDAMPLAHKSWKASKRGRWGPSAIKEQTTLKDAETVTKYLGAFWKLGIKEWKGAPNPYRPRKNK